jgi:hypothetical protein
VPDRSCPLNNVASARAGLGELVDLLDAIRGLNAWLGSGGRGTVDLGVNLVGEFIFAGGGVAGDFGVFNRGRSLQLQGGSLVMFKQNIYIT